MADRNVREMCDVFQFGHRMTYLKAHAQFSRFHIKAIKKSVGFLPILSKVNWKLNMRELNLRFVLWPTSGILKCIPNSSVSDYKSVIKKKKKQ